MDHVNLAITVAVECQTSVLNSLQGSGQLTVLQLLKAKETASQRTIPQESGAAGVQLYSLFVIFLYSML